MAAPPTMTILKFAGSEDDGLPYNIKISLTKVGRARLGQATGGKNIIGESSDTLVVFGHPDRVVNSKRPVRVLAAMDHGLRDMINLALINQRIDDRLLKARVETFFDRTCGEEGAWERLLLGIVPAANTARVPVSDASGSGGTKRGPVAADDLRATKVAKKTVVVLTDDDEDIPDIITDAVAVAASPAVAPAAVKPAAAASPAAAPAAVKPAAAASPAAAPAAVKPAAAKPPMTYEVRVAIRAKLLEVIEHVDNIGSQTHQAGVIEGTRYAMRILEDIQDSFA